MIVVGLVGTKGVGKDTAARILVEKHAFQARKFAQPIKAACAILFQVPESHFEGPEKEAVVPRHGLSPRQMMQLVGTDMFRTIVHRDFWVRHFEDWVAEQEPDAKIVVTDVRFANEVDAIRRLGGTVVRIVRASSDHGSDAHVSETGVAALRVDREIQNNGTIEQLWDEVQAAIW